MSFSAVWILILLVIIASNTAPDQSAGSGWWILNALALLALGSLVVVFGIWLLD